MNKLDYKLFEKFINNHDKLIVKPIGSAFGKGIYLVNIKKEQKSNGELFETILEMEECILEEKIQQSVDMACFHPQSENTVRFATYIEDNEVKK